MPSAVAGAGSDTTTSRLQTGTVPERKADYFIGASGLPILTSPTVKMHRSSAPPMGDGVRNSKLNKCLYNTAIRNGGAPPGTIAGHFDGSSGRRSCKTESDITAIKSATGGRFGKSPSPSTITLSTSSAGCAVRFGNAGRTGATVGGWPTASSISSSSSSNCSNRSRSNSSSPSFGMSNTTGKVHQKSCPPPRLLSARSSNSGTTAAITSSRSSNRPQDGRLTVSSQQCRYSNHHKQLDNRLTYQRSYDRNIFGYDQRMDQFVLPPLQS